MVNGRVLIWFFNTLSEYSHKHFFSMLFLRKCFLTNSNTQSYLDGCIRLGVLSCIKPVLSSEPQPLQCEY